MNTTVTNFTFFILLFISYSSIAQKDSAAKINFSGYTELYYSYDFSNPNRFEKPDFNYNYKKHNQFNVNLAFIKANYQNSQFRSNLALMTGNYATYNLSSEPNWARPIFEANLGFKLLRKHQLWLDAGVMPSHIGFESAIGSDCWNLTRSILAENSPYYETGIKLNYTNRKQNLFFAFHVLNGWQKIALSPLYTKPSFGLQVNYKPNSTLTLNYSNFVGTAKPDSVKSLRVFHNLYAIYDASTSVSFILGFDVGTEKIASLKPVVWYTPILVSRVHLNSKNKIAGRLEFYKDAKQVVIQTGTPNGYQTLGASINYDFQLSPKLLWRAEYKRYQSMDAIYRYDTPNRMNQTATVAMVYRF